MLSWCLHFIFALKALNCLKNLFDVLYFLVLATEPYAVFTISLKSQASEEEEEEHEGTMWFPNRSDTNQAVQS